MVLQLFELSTKFYRHYTTHFLCQQKKGLLSAIFAVFAVTSWKILTLSE